MGIKYYKNNEQYTVGMTLKNELHADEHNMAFHLAEHNEDVVKNREKLASDLNSRLSNFVCPKQTHSSNIYHVTNEDRGRGAHHIETAINDVDALYTYEANIVLCTFSADCVPVLFYNEKSGLIGIIHSGWRGTVAEITSHVFTKLTTVEQCHIEDFRVFIGPAISQEKFEVDDDVYHLYKKLQYANDFIYYNELTNKYHVDNKLVVKRQCEKAGILSEHITIDPMCTFIDENGFSYRKNKTRRRHMGFIVKK